MIVAILALVVALGGVFVILGATDIGRKFILSALVLGAVLPVVLCVALLVAKSVGGGASLATIASLMFAIGHFRVSAKEAPEKLAHQNAVARWLGRQRKRRIERIG